MAAQQHPKHLKLQLIASSTLINIYITQLMNALKPKSQFALIEFIYLDAGKNISQQCCRFE